MGGALWRCPLCTSAPPARANFGLPVAVDGQASRYHEEVGPYKPVALINSDRGLYASSATWVLRKGM